MLGLAYLSGSIPFGLLIGRWVRRVDIRDYGSGNIGTTNAMRVLGARWAAVIFALDVAKGALPVWLAQEVVVSLLGQAAVGLLAVAGHNWSVFLRFRGGKGVATSLGVLLATAPLAAGVAAIVWVLTVAASGYASLGSMIGLTAAAAALLLSGQPEVLALMGAVLAAVAVWQHRANIRRLVAGKELRWGQKSGPS